MRTIGLVAISALALLSTSVWAETPVERGSYLFKSRSVIIS